MPLEILKGPHTQHRTPPIYNLQAALLVQGPRGDTQRFPIISSSPSQLLQTAEVLFVLLQILKEPLTRLEPLPATVCEQSCQHSRYSYLCLRRT